MAGGRRNGLRSGGDQSPAQKSVIGQWWSSGRSGEVRWSFGVREAALESSGCWEEDAGGFRANGALWRKLWSLEGAGVGAKNRCWDSGGRAAVEGRSGGVWGQERWRWNGMDVRKAMVVVRWPLESPVVGGVGWKPPGSAAE